MANEITVTLSLRASKSPLTVEPTTKTFNADMSGTDYASGTQIIGSSEEAISIGEVTTPGWCYFENLDTTNSIHIRAATGVANGITLLPGKACLFYAAAAGFFAISSAGSPVLKKVILEA